MPTRKQKARRAKGRRHEYEYVYVDETGQEVEVDEAEADTPAPKGGAKPAAKAKPKAGTSARTTREPPEPSWSRAAKRAIPWQIGILLLIVLVLKDSPLVSRIMIAILYGALFVPMMYMTDRMMRNRWLKQQGKLPAKDKQPRR